MITILLPKQTTPFQWEGTVDIPSQMVSWISPSLNNGSPLPWIGYDGCTDLNENTIAYTTQVSLYTIDDVVMCKAFMTNLKGRPQTGSPISPIFHPLLRCIGTILYNILCHKSASSPYLLGISQGGVSVKLHQQVQ